MIEHVGDDHLQARARKRLGKAGPAGITGTKRDQRAGARAGDTAGKGFGDTARSEDAPADFLLC